MSSQNLVSILFVISRKMELIEERCILVQVPSLASKKASTKSSNLHPPPHVSSKTIISFPDWKVNFNQEVSTSSYTKVFQTQDDSAISVSSDENDCLALNLVLEEAHSDEDIVRRCSNTFPKLG